MRRPARVLAILVPVVLLAAACASAGTTSAPPMADGGRGVAGPAGDAAFQTTVDSKGVPGAIPAPEFATNSNIVTNASRNLILTANVAMKSQDPWADRKSVV